MCPWSSAKDEWPSTSITTLGATPWAREAGGGVAAVVEPVVRHAGLLLELGEAPGDLGPVQRRPAGCAEDQIVFLPPVGAAPLEKLPVAVRGQLLDAHPRQGDGAAAGPGLGSLNVHSWPRRSRTRCTRSNPSDRSTSAHFSPNASLGRRPTARATV